jgi:fructose-specific phosphotransferase system IIA component
MVAEYLPKRAIKISLNASDKRTVIAELVELLCDVYGLKNKDEILESVLEREEMMSTGVGYGVAIPHTKLGLVNSPKMVAGLSGKGIDFDSIDGEPAKIFFLLISPKNGSGEHVRILSELSRILNNPEAREKVLSAETDKDFLEIVKSYED